MAARRRGDIAIARQIGADELHFAWRVLRRFNFFGNSLQPANGVFGMGCQYISRTALGTRSLEYRYNETGDCDPTIINCSVPASVSTICSAKYGSLLML